MDRKNNGLSAAERFLVLFPPCGKDCRRRVTNILWLLLVFLPLYQFYLYRFNLLQWDLLLITGLAAYILRLHLAGRVQELFFHTVNRLFVRECLALEEERKNRFVQGLEEHAGLCARAGGIATATAMLAAFSLGSMRFSWSHVVPGIGEIAGAYFLGTYLGRMASYGKLGWHLQKEGVAVKVQPLHPDGVAGLKPVGDFFSSRPWSRPSRPCSWPPGGFSFRSGPGIIPSGRTPTWPFSASP